MKSGFFIASSRNSILLLKAGGNEMSARCRSSLSLSLATRVESYMSFAISVKGKLGGSDGQAVVPREGIRGRAKSSRVL